MTATNVVTFIVFLGIVQGTFLGITLLSIKRGNRKANRILGILMLVLALTLNTHILSNTKFYLICPHLLLITHPFVFLYGPLLYLYTKAATARRFEWRKKYALLFLPFLLLIGYYALTFYFQSGEYKIMFKEGNLTQRGIFWSLITPFQLLYLFIHAFAIQRILQRHRKNIKTTFAYLEKITLDWIRLISLLFIVAFAYLSSVILIRILGYEIFAMNIGRHFYALLIVFIIYLMGFKGIHQPEIFTGGNSYDPVRKYGSSPLTPSKAKRYLDQLRNIMKTKKPYTNPKLTLKTLADLMSIPSYQVSQIINEYLNQNFFDFVNSHRIQEAKQMLKDPKSRHYSILAIAYDVGFHSKSAFNAAFKKHADTTPSQYRQQAI